MHKKNFIYIIFFLLFLCAKLPAFAEDQVKIKKIQSILKRYEKNFKKDPHNLKLALAIAETYYSIREYGKAAEFYQYALGLDPENPKIKTELALSYLANNDLIRSSKLFEELIKIEPRNPDILAGLGRVAALKHEVSQAEDFYQQALEIYPQHFTVLYYLAELRIDQQRYLEAQEMLENLLKRDPNASWVQQALKRAKLGPILEKIKNLENEGNIKEAISIYKQQIEENPDSLDLSIGLGQLYTQTKHHQKAIELLKNALKEHPTAVQLRLALGFAYLANRKFDRAKNMLQTAYNEGADKSEALAGLGRIAALKGNPEEAEKLYQKSLSLNSSNVLTLSYFAALRMDQKRFSEAQQLFEEIVEINPKALWAKQAIEEAKIAPLLEKIKEEEKIKNYVNAERLYKQLIVESLGNIESYIKLAEFYIRQKKYPEAVEVYLQALGTHPQSMRLYVLLGYAYLLNGEIAKSQSAFDYAVKNGWLAAETLAGLGRVNVAIGNLEEALDLYQWALMIDPNDIAALSSLAEFRMEQKEFSQAQNLFQKLLKIIPKAEWVKQALLQAQDGPALEDIRKLKEEGELEEAVIRYQQLLLASPENTQVYLELGQIYRQEKRYKDALDLYQTGLQNHPSSIPLRTALGMTYLEIHELEKAKRILQKVFTEDPTSTEAIAGLGRIAALSDDIEHAIDLYQLALDLNPNDIFVLSSFAELWMEEKQFAKAQQLYEAIVNIKPKDAWAQQSLEDAKHGPLLEEIHAKEKNKDFKEVEELYKQLIEESPKSADYYVKLGQFYVRMKQYEEAIIIYLQGLEQQPDSAQLQVALGFAYLAKGDLSVAESVFEKMLKNDPANAEALSGMGRLAEINGDFNSAKAFYEEAIRSQPNNITALTFMAELMLDLGHYDTAQKLFKRLLRLEPSSQWIKLAVEDAKHGRLIGQIKKKEARDYKGAEILYQQLLVEAPNIADYYLRAGLFYHRNKQYQKAIDVYLKGIKVDPKSAELYAALGLVYLSKKDPAAAKGAFHKALKFDPANSDALAGLGSVAILNKNLKKAQTYILAALNVDRDNIAALSSLGNLRMIEKRYPEAQEAYARLMELRPEEKWIKPLFQNAKYGTVLDEIKQLVEIENFSEAAQLYHSLIARAPDNPQYYVGLGQMYFRLKEYSDAINVYLQGLQESPEERELLLSLGYAYLFNKNLPEARRALSQALREDLKNPEALAGLGRIAALEDNFFEAEDLYKQALSISPINLSALTFYSDLLMKQKQYAEAQNILIQVQALLPKAEWVPRALKDAEDGPITGLANMYANREQFELAAELYCRLVQSSPDDPSRYLPLGQMYVYTQRYNQGICIFQQGLMFDSEAFYLWRAIAFAYLQMADYHTSRCIFMYLLSEDNEDAESWAGLGQVEARYGSPCCAERYFLIALDIDPKNMTALSSLAALREEQQYFFSALQLYALLMEIDSKPKWVRRGYNSLLSLAFPTINAVAAYHEEDQWDPTVNKWSAQYLVYGGRILINYPISDELILWGRCVDEFFILNDLLEDFTIYSFDVQRLYLAARWIYNPCFFIEARAGITNFSPYRDASFCMLRGTIAEPALIFTYHQPLEKASLIFSSDSDLVARNFSTNVAKLFGRYYISGTYERQVLRRGWMGLEADAYWYRDFVDNTSQRAFGWFQWRPPCYSENILFRYHVKYQRFAHNIPDYYTYKDQVVNHLQLTLEKYWRVCWACSFYTSLSYAHGWQDTRTRFGQIIVVQPTPLEPPLFWDRRQYNTVFGSMIYTYGQLQFSLLGDYYRDTEKYTMWSIIADLRWRF